MYGLLSKPLFNGGALSMKLRLIQNSSWSKKKKKKKKGYRHYFLFPSIYRLPLSLPSKKKKYKKTKKKQKKHFNRLLKLHEESTRFDIHLTFLGRKKKKKKKRGADFWKNFKKKNKED